ncbi:MAG: DNA repair protein RecN, partial [Streptosporangiaceae bacterium]
MLEEVRITRLGVIDDAVLEFSAGFNVVTGETGAGKTMVVTGLGLLFGGRADPSRVRPGADRAAVEGRLRVDPDGAAARQVSEAGGDLDDQGATLLLGRSVSAEGRSRATAGGRSVPVSLLTYLSEDLIAVHGQADQQQLLRPGRQREALDRFGGPQVAGLLAAYQRAYRTHQLVREELTELTTQARDRAREAADLHRGLAEVERAQPCEGEDIELLAQEDRLANADALHAAAATAHEALLGDASSADYAAADAVTLLGVARQALEAAVQHDPGLAALGARLSEAAYLASDVATELASYAQSVEADPARLAAVQQRRAELARLVRAYGSDPPPGPLPGGDLAAVLRWAKAAAARVGELDTDDDRIAALAAREAELAAAVAEEASQLTAARTRTAGRFASQVTGELTALAMPHARLTVVVAPAAECGPHGADEVEIRLAAHPGSPALPLGKGASGGELSRT